MRSRLFFVTVAAAAATLVHARFPIKYGHDPVPLLHRAHHELVHRGRTATNDGHVRLRVRDSTTREYNFTISQEWLAPDGYWRQTFAINGQTPGPTITATEGDTVRVNVVNYCNTQSTVHFHGINQVDPQQDGVPGLTQWNILPYGNWTYEWKAVQSGAYWYHSHSRGTYVDGLRGPIIIQPADDVSRPWSAIENSSYNSLEQAYKQAVPLMLHEWRHETFDNAMIRYRSTGKEPYCSDTMLINSQGRVKCMPADKLKSMAGAAARFGLQDYIDPTGCVPSTASFKGRLANENARTCTDTSSAYGVYPTSSFGSSDGNWASFHLINAGGEWQSCFSIDGHDLWIVARDAHFVQPQKVQVVQMTLGSRYTVIVPTNGTLGRYRIRLAACGNLPQISTGYAVLDIDKASSSPSTSSGPSSTALPNSSSAPSSVSSTGVSSRSSSDSSSGSPSSARARASGSVGPSSGSSNSASGSSSNSASGSSSSNSASGSSSASSPPSSASSGSAPSSTAGSPTSSSGSKSAASRRQVATPEPSGVSTVTQFSSSQASALDLPPEIIGFPVPSEQPYLPSPSEAANLPLRDAKWSNGFPQSDTSAGQALGWKVTNDLPSQGTKYLHYNGSVMNGAIQQNESALKPFTPEPPPQGKADYTFSLALNMTNVVTWSMLGSKKTLSSLNFQGQPILFERVAASQLGADLPSDTLLQVKNGSVVDFIFQDVQTPFGPNPPHPIHKHNEQVWFLGTGSGTLNYSDVEDILAHNASLIDMQTPELVDSWVVPARGWSIVRHQVRRAAVTLMHCHIAQHLGAAMGVVLIEAPELLNQTSISSQNQNAPHVPPPYVPANGLIGLSEL